MSLENPVLVGAAGMTASKFAAAVLDQIRERMAERRANEGPETAPTVQREGSHVLILSGDATVVPESETTPAPTVDPTPALVGTGR